MPTILAIETSCDDTCVAVLESGEDLRLRANLVSSQLVHADFEGVVPELASREHLKLLGPLVRQALDEAGLGLDAIDAVAVTNGPGLIGSLLVGVSLAKALAFSRGLPLVGVNHIEAHLSAAALEFGDRASPPLVGLVASGGHTEIVEIPEWGDWKLLGATRDDAAGEAFDKVAKLLGLGFPGGPALAREASAGNPAAYDFPRAWLGIGTGGLDLSFSGLKTAVRVFLERAGWPERPSDPEERKRFVADVAASFQEAVVEVLTAKILAAAEQAGARRVVVAGGVAANRRLREMLVRRCEEARVDLVMPSPALCGDNAAMVAVSASRVLARGLASRYDLAAIPNLDDWRGFYEPQVPPTRPMGTG